MGDSQVIKCTKGVLTNCQNEFSDISDAAPVCRQLLNDFFLISHCFFFSFVPFTGNWRFLLDMARLLSC